MWFIRDTLRAQNRDSIFSSKAKLVHGIALQFADPRRAAHGELSIDDLIIAKIGPQTVAEIKLRDWVEGASVYKEWLMAQLRGLPPRLTEVENAERVEIV